MTEMFGEAWSPMSVPDLAPDDDDDMRALHFLSEKPRKASPQSPHQIGF